MSEKNQIVVVLIVALLLGSVRRPDHGLKDSRWSGSAVDAAEPANGLRMYPESCSRSARAIFGARVPRRHNEQFTSLRD